MNREAEEFRISSEIKEANNEVLRGRLEQAEALLKRAAEICTFNTPDEIVVLDIEEFLASQQGEQVKHPEQAEGAQGERVPDKAFEAEFMTWWEDHGQYCRSGGGDYERTFAFQAWRHLYPQLMAARAALSQPSPATELEQVGRFDPAHGTDRGGNVFAYMCDNEAGEYMEFAQHDRIVGALRAEVDAHVEVAHSRNVAMQQAQADARRYKVERDAANGRLHEVATACATAEQQRDAALSRLAELEQREPEVLGCERYHVEKTGHGFWPYCVRAGDGTRELFVGHLKQCERVAAQLASAFEDGKFAARPVPAAQAWQVPDASAQDKVLGWTLDYRFVERVTELAASRTEYSTSMEATEQVLLAARELLDAAPAQGE